MPKQVVIPSIELFDEERGVFITTKETVFSVEHSLVSISKWEAKWEKPFLSKVAKTPEEMLDYIRCMTITPNVDPEIYKVMPNEVVKDICNYIEKPMTATTFSKRPAGGGREIITSEIIYYDMIALQIPVEFQEWHLNRLLTLIRVCSEKNAPPKKMSKNAIRNQNSALNAMRRAKSGSRG